RVIFTIVNFSKTKSLYREGMTPVVKSTSRPKMHVYYYRCPEHRKNYVLSFALPTATTVHLHRLQAYLDSLERKGLDYVQRDLLGLSVQQRRLDLLTVSHPDNLTDEAQKRVVFITARVHPGETPASFVCQGLIDFLVSSHPIAKQLRDYLVFKIIPMLNPDGVYLGNYRCSLMGFDLNRHWQEPSPWAHPTIYACKKAMIDMYNSKDHDIDFFCDLHAHSTLMNGFMYGNTFDDPDKQERQNVFPKLFQQNAEDFSLTNTNFNRDAVKAGTGRRLVLLECDRTWMLSYLVLSHFCTSVLLALVGIFDDSVLCYTLEVSFFSYMANSSGGTLPYTEEGYAKLGRNLARTFLDYYKVQSVIPSMPVAGATGKSKGGGSGGASGGGAGGKDSSSR
uniref:Peptidase_M14 domain-containing protein n=1 Tax=Macrostomum lignano TaxID=282301 RepID=A0A1I8FTS3_9PLAT